jgi:hypothetical protein
VPDYCRQLVGVHPVIADQLPPRVAVRRVELERHAVDREAVAQVVAAGFPLLTDDAVHRVARTVSLRPCAEGLLHLGVDPLLWVDPPLHHPEVDLPECTGALQGGQFGERDPGVVLVHVEQQYPGDTAVQPGGSLQEADAVVVGQVQVGGHECHLLPVQGRPLKRGESGVRRVGGHHPVVRHEPAGQGCRRRRHVQGVGAHYEQQRRAPDVGRRVGVLGGDAGGHCAVTEVLRPGEARFKK